MGLFLLVFCFLRENYVRSWAFPDVSVFSVRAQKLNQHPAVTYDMGNRDFETKRNKCCCGSTSFPGLFSAEEKVGGKWAFSRPFHFLKEKALGTRLAVDIFFVDLLFLRGHNIHDKHQSKTLLLYGAL